MNFKIEGIITPIITPFNDMDGVDEQALRRVIRYVMAGGVHGVFIGGSTGESYAIETKERVHAIEITVDEVAGKLPVYAGTGDITTRKSVELALAAKAAGAYALSIVTPYFITPNEKEIIDHYTTIAKAVYDMPILLYNNPDRTGVTISVNAIKKLSELPNILGIKDSSGEMTYVMEILRNAPKTFGFFCGKDTMIFPTLVAGGKGAVPASSNVAPKLICALYAAVKNGDMDLARQLQFKLAPLRLAFSLGSFPVVLKEALNLIGLNVGTTRLPISPLLPEKREQLKKILTQMDLIE